MSTPRLVPIGRIVGVFGVQGWLKLQSFTEPRDNILSYSPLYLQQTGDWQPRRVLAARAHGKGLVIQLEGVSTRDQAAELIGAELSVARTQLPELAQGEYYWADLTGLSVYNLEGVELGQVSHLFATGANDVLVVVSQGHEYWIPYVPDRYVMAVDIAAGRLQVDWPAEETSDHVR